MIQWIDLFIDYAWSGLYTTIILSIVSGILSVVVGTVLGGLASISRLMRPLVWIYSQIWRGLPVLVTLFGMFFLLPSLDMSPTPVTTVIVGLSLWGSANIAEIVLGALRSIPATQTTAAIALGFRPIPALWYIVLPQAVRRMLPSVVGILVVLIQATALASAIGAVDLLESVNRFIEHVSNETGSSHALIIYSALMVIYFLICSPLTHFARRLEHRQRNLD